MAGRYATGTDVPVSRTRAEIEDTLARYGASGFLSGYEDNRAFLGFRLRDRHVKFILPLPDPNEREFWQTNHASPRRRTADQARAAWDQACRARWRALLLSIKAKLEAVEVGITSFDDEFMAHLVLPDGKTVGQHMRPQIQLAYETGDMPPLLPPPEGHNG
ncbi:MAG: hypothetical protein VYB54_07715 [Pseudomonadota bacterium]|nr:hypothetical protein [Pseudomonadota bacterium]